MQNFRNLKVWQKAHELTLAVYKSTRAFPAEELYGLTSQMRRAAVSVGSNLAEGCGRQGDAEFGRFAQIALGSVCELDYQVLLSRDLEFLDANSHDRLAVLVDETRRMLIGLLQRLRLD